MSFLHDMRERFDSGTLVDDFERRSFLMIMARMMGVETDPDLQWGNEVVFIGKQRKAVVKLHNYSSITIRHRGVMNNLELYEERTFHQIKDWLNGDTPDLNGFFSGLDPLWQPRLHSEMDITPSF